MRCTARHVLNSLIMLVVIGGSGAHAQITLDGSMGIAGALTGPNFTIPSTVGQTRGSNLFHSFGLFNVLTSQSATFTGPNSISNIFGRVTGGQPSTIDGTIRSTILNANLFLMNPAGMMFGPNALLDVRGSFHATTADYLKFADGAKFHAELARASVLTTAAVSAFGFLSQNPAGIDIAKSSLQVPSGKTLSIVAGDIDIAGGLFSASNDIPTLGAPAGTIQLASVGSPGEVPVNVENTNLASFERLGNIEVTNSAYLEASGNGGGTVIIRGGKLLVDASSIFADNLGNTHGAGLGLDIGLRESVIANDSQLTSDSFRSGRARGLRIEAETLELNNALVTSSAFLSGDSADVTVTLGRLTLTNGALIAADTFGLGNAGDVVVQAMNVTLSGGSGLASGAFRSGNGGNIRVTAGDTVSLNGFSLISSSSQPGSSGNAGDVVVEAMNVNVRGGSEISSGTFGRGNGGLLRVTASDTIALDSLGVIASSSDRGSSGNAGNIVVEAKNLTVTGGAEIGAATFGTGDGGTIRVTASGTISLDGAGQIAASNQAGSNGNAGNIVIEAKNVVLTGGSQIASAAFGTGDGGTIRVTASDTISLDGDSSRIAASNLRGSSGNAGNIVVEAKNVTVTAGAQISSDALESGNGGTVRVTASDTISLHGNSSQISASNGLGSTGNAGDIVVEARNVTLTGVAGIANSVFGSGNGGTIRLTASETISLTSDGIISASTLGAGNAGSIEIVARNVIATGGQIGSVTRDSGNGGPVTIRASDNVIFTGVDGTDVVTGISSGALLGGSGHAGNVLVTAKNVTLTRALIDSETLGPGNGGTLTVQASDTIRLADHASITATSGGTGNAGDILIEAREFRSVNSSVTTDTDFADGGNIHLKVSKLVELTNSQITTGVLGGQGQGGNITIDPQFVILNHSQISANAFGGPGGNITIIADNFFASPDSSITASSALSTPGTVDIQAPIVDLSGSIAPLPDAIVQASTLLRQSCAARFSSGKTSRLAAIGRDSTPYEPGGLLASSLFTSANFSTSQNTSEAVLIASAHPKFSIASPCVTLY